MGCGCKTSQERTSRGPRHVHVYKGCVWEMKTRKVHFIPVDGSRVLDGVQWWTGVLLMFLVLLFEKITNANPYPCTHDAAHHLLPAATTEPQELELSDRPALELPYPESTMLDPDERSNGVASVGLVGQTPSPCSGSDCGGGGGGDGGLAGRRVCQTTSPIMRAQAIKKKTMIASCCFMIGRSPLRRVWAGAMGAMGRGAMARSSVDYVCIL